MHLPKPTEGGDFTPPPEGTFPAICYRFIDLGTQQTVFSGETKTQHKVLISWELKDEEAILEDGTPMSAHVRYTWSMHERAKLRKHLEAWRGAKFTDADFGPGGFEVRNLLSKQCLVSIGHEEKDGRTYANVLSIAKLPRGMTAGSLINPPVFLSLELGEFDKAVFDTLSDGLKATITKSPEYQQLIGRSTPIRAASNGTHQMPADTDMERWGPAAETF